MKIGFPFNITESDGEILIRSKTPCTLADLDTQDFFVFPQDDGSEINDADVCMVMKDTGNRVAIWNFGHQADSSEDPETHVIMLRFDNQVQFRTSRPGF